MSDTPRGRFCWHELMTSDPRAAIDFYTNVTGWSTQEWDGPVPYTMWMRGDEPIGGIVRLDDEQLAQGVPPNWLPYLSTPDVDATAAKCSDLGGETVMGPEDYPDVGRVALFRDPHGAVFSCLQPAHTTPGHDDPAEVGEFSWHELATDDWKQAFAFYSALFGWEEADAMDMGEGHIYQMFSRGAHPLGGMFNRPPEIPMPNWLSYVRVDDVAPAAEAVKSGGGKILNGPMEVPGGDMIVQCADPQGAAFAMHSVGGA